MALNNDMDELKPLEPVKDNEILGFNHIPNTQSSIMNNSVLHKASTRGNANHGWLQSYHTFSFANYYNPERMHFGVLRVLNDDTVQGGMGFGTHPHDNMGNKQVIKQGDVQVMSAGTGITHSEYNKNKDATVKFLQIWVFPNKRNVTPRYDQITLKPEDRHNQLQQILSPNADDAGVWIHQDAWFHLGQFDADKSTHYAVKRQGNGIYAFVLSGSFEINGQALEKRDGLGIWDVNKIDLKALASGGEILLMEVPMSM